jgi:hypothetical protein
MFFFFLKKNCFLFKNYIKIVFIFIFHINILKLLKNILKNINLIFYFKKIKKTKVTHTKKRFVFAVQKYF